MAHVMEAERNMVGKIFITIYLVFDGEFRTFTVSIIEEHAAFNIYTLHWTHNGAFMRDDNTNIYY